MFSGFRSAPDRQGELNQDWHSDHKDSHREAERALGSEDDEQGYDEANERGTARSSDPVAAKRNVARAYEACDPQDRGDRQRDRRAKKDRSGHDDRAVAAWVDRREHEPDRGPRQGGKDEEERVGQPVDAVQTSRLRGT